MSWQDNPYMLLSFVAAAVSATSALFIWRTLRAPGAGTMVLLLTACAEWTVAYALELGSPDLDSAVCRHKAMLAGVAIVPTAWLMFTLRYTGNDRWLTIDKLILLGIMPALTELMISSNDLTKLMWSDARLNWSGNFALLDVAWGAGFWAHTLYSYVILAGAAFVLVQALSRSRRLYRWHGPALLFAASVPWLGNILFITGINPFPGVDLTALGFNVTSLVFAWSLSRLRLGDIVSVSRGTIIQSISDGLMVLDAEGHLLELNPAAEKLFGHASTDVIGKSVQLLWPNWPGKNWVAAPGSSTGHEVGLGDHTYDVRISPVTDPRGRLVSQIVALRDITKRLQLEEQLFRAQRLETAGRIAGQVAHDFNNLLSPLSGYPELIKMQLPEGHVAIQYCNLMLEAAERMAYVNEELLSLGRRGHFVQESSDLNELVEQTAAQISDNSASVSIRMELAEDLKPVSGAEAQLQRVIANLMSNGREAMQEGGVLTVITENVHVGEPSGALNGLEPGDYVRLTVVDTGCGIPQEIQSKIFDAFFSTKQSIKRRGCGLGLSVVQAVVEDHRGYLELESEVGVGTSFRVYLPVSDEPLKTKVSGPIAGGKERLLVVDDDQFQREVTRDLLQILGYRVYLVASGEEALARLESQSMDLLILDLEFPSGMDGVETYRRVLERRPVQKAIIMSGSADTLRVQELQAMGAGECLRKPVPLERLAHAVREELDRRN